MARKSQAWTSSPRTWRSLVRRRAARAGAGAGWGTEDRFNPVGGALKLLQGCRDARFVLINRCGHWVMVEHSDYFNRECLGFLADTAEAAV